MTLREKIDCMEAFERGEEIECATAGYDTSWHYVKTPSWNWKENDYRIKTRQKKVVVLETWLCGSQEDDSSYIVIEGTSQYFKEWYLTKVKLLSTREVEL